MLITIGCWEGFIVGKREGLEVGIIVGNEVGSTDGNIVGNKVGENDVGKYDGSSVGKHVGSSEGTIGFIVGLIETGFAVGCLVGAHFIEKFIKIKNITFHIFKKCKYAVMFRSGLLVTAQDQ